MRAGPPRSIDNASKRPRGKPSPNPCTRFVPPSLCDHRAHDSRMVSATMLTDPAAAAWRAAGSPEVDVSAHGRCGRCGDDGPSVASSRVISERFTDFDAWPYGSRRLCAACAWAYSRQPKTQPTMLITSDAVTEYSTPGAVADLLAAGALSNTAAVVLPTARRRHILPAAQWAHLATEGLVVRWDAAAARRLQALIRLRLGLDLTWPQLSNPAPPAEALRTQPPDTWSAILAAWALLHPWRKIPQLWAGARVLSARTTDAQPATAPNHADDQQLL